MVQAWTREGKSEDLGASTKSLVPRSVVEHQNGAEAR
jgi:hypothetical protein